VYEGFGLYTITRCVNQMDSEQIEFASDGFTLHGSLSTRESQRNASVIILHPHPLYGGNMNNHVVKELGRIFRREGFTTFRFDFRGASASPLGYSGIAGAVSDALNAIATLKSLTGHKKVGIAGYSFGAAVAFRVALLTSPLFLVSLSASKALIMEDSFDIESLGNIECPTLMFHGKDDDVISFEDLLDIAEEIRLDLRSTKFLEGEGHFYQKSLPRVGSAIHELIETLYA
jgi:alpha/beta superfamily hydrolase